MVKHKPPLSSLIKDKLSDMGFKEQISHFKARQQVYGRLTAAENREQFDLVNREGSLSRKERIRSENLEAKWQDIARAKEKEGYSRLVKDLEFLLSKKPPKKKDVILDLGTGVGILPVVAKSIKPAQYIGVDISNVALKETKARIKKSGLDISLIRADISDKGLHIPIKKLVDQIWINNVNLQNRKHTLKEAGKMLKPGGVIKETGEVSVLLSERGVKDHVEREYSECGLEAETKVIPVGEWEYIVHTTAKKQKLPSLKSQK